MSFSQNDVEKISHLARLDIDKESIKSIAEDLNNILGLVSQIAKVDTNHIEPMEHTQNAEQPCRADAITEPDVRESMQALVPSNATAAGLYLVPKVID